MRLLALNAAALLVIALSADAGYATANIVPPSRAGLFVHGTVANDLKPAQCAALNLSTIVTGDGNLAGTRGSDLIIGGPAAQTLTGAGGDDCLIGGGGDDVLRGGKGDDVLIAGPGDDDLDGANGADTLYGGDGDDNLDGGKQADACYGGAGTDTFKKCESWVQ